MQQRRSVLISGASIAGPALAYWLHKYGFDVSVVERGATVRPGGLPIDVRGAAMEVGKRMGIDDELFAAHVNTQRYNFVDEAGEIVSTVHPPDLTGDVVGRDVEVARDALTNMLWVHTRDDVPYIFNESIATLVDHGDRVDVTFQNGTPPRSFDVVIGADGLHSNTRRLVFGDESQFEKYIGRYFASFTAENALGLSREVMCLNLVSRNRMAIQFAASDKPARVFCGLSFDCPNPPPLEKRDLEGQRRLFQEVFGDVGWEAPRMLKALMEDDDVFCDTVSQIHMPHLSKGRVAIVGDAAYAPSFLSGQGTSLALVGAYVLAGELAANSDHRAGMKSYERIMRPFIKANQEIATGGRKKVNPRTQFGLHLRNFMFKVLFPLLKRVKLGRFVGGKNRAATTAIDLPDYSSLVSAV